MIKLLSEKAPLVAHWQQQCHSRIEFLLERGGVPLGKSNLMRQDGFLSTLNDVDTFDSPAQAFTSADGVP